MKHHLVFAVFTALCALPALAQNANSQLNAAAGQSQSAAYQSSSEGARTGAGAGFDTGASANTSVNLGAGTTPSLLRNSDGTNPYSPYEGRPIRTTPPPRLP